MNDKIVKKLYKLCEKCIEIDEVPVSCVIVKDNRIVSTGYNKKYHFYDPLGHAEIIAIKKACRLLKTSNLSECTMFVSLKPCKMCCEVIKEAKIEHVFYILEHTKDVNRDVYLECINDCDYNMFKCQLSNFFEKKR